MMPRLIPAQYARRSLVLTQTFAVATAVSLAVSAVSAQTPPAGATRVPPPRVAAAASTPQARTPLSGSPLTQSSGGPITIDADKLEVRDKEKKAIFIGNVVATRGESTVRAAQMIVFYSGNAPGTPAQPAAQTPAAPGQSGSQQIRRIEMSGKVLFTQRDQNATGDQAVYEKEGEKETLTMLNNVILTQGQNVVTGCKLVVDLKTTQAQVESCTGGRVRSILVPDDKSQTPAAAPRPVTPPKLKQ